MHDKLSKGVSLLIALFAASMTSTVAMESSHEAVSDEVIAEQRANLATNTDGKGFGPQAPRDIDSIDGTNARACRAAPAYT